MSLRKEISATIHAQAHRTREHLHAAAEALKHPKDALKDHEHHNDSVPEYCYDLAFHFIGASGLPQLDVGGLSDPYFNASLDGKVHYTSSIQVRTLQPVWHEHWNVKNVPESATLEVKLYDKDDGAVRDDYIGSFKTRIQEGANEYRIESSAGAQMGTMWLEVKKTPTKTPDTPHYAFDGPVNFSRHFNPTVGLFAGSKNTGPVTDRQDDIDSVDGTKPQYPNPPLTNKASISSEERMRRHAYSTWKVHLKGISLFFGDQHQHWLESYPAAQRIFKGPIVVRAGIRSAHRILYARTTMNDFGLINDANDFWRELAPQDRQQALAAEKATSSAPSGRATWLVKPTLYTYIIGDDDMFRFSETGAAFLTDFASKHALHACCAETVRYSGEFHARPVIEGGWAGLGGRLPPEDVEWELWIDNSSGTYGPDKTLLPALEQTIEYNFPGIRVRAFDYHDEELSQSKKDLLDYAQNKPNLTRPPTQTSTSQADQRQESDP